jgi:hypothetical protein
MAPHAGSFGRKTRHSETVGTAAVVVHMSGSGKLQPASCPLGFLLVTPPTEPGCAGGSRELPWTCYAGFVGKRAHIIGSPRTDRTASASFEELAAQQGVKPIDDFETLLGAPSREDESAEEFSASLRDWRREGTFPASPR